MYLRTGRVQVTLAILVTVRSCIAHLTFTDVVIVTHPVFARGLFITPVIKKLAFLKMHEVKLKRTFKNDIIKQFWNNR